ncbi:MAG TPA: U32 family peptidase [Spirochaetota bacterium]|nr:U32 family peptidase [Spirochaetota bacterium]
MNKPFKVELLSPAKNADFGISAVNCGADAVYIGADKFGARKNASNSIADIARLVSYSHKFRAKVYAAVNTVFNDEEIEHAVKLIHELYDAGIDGIIIQDMGVLECSLPPVKLIASTQTENSSPEKVKFLEDCGFSRVILARELGLKEIREIRRNTSVELEAFVHGAACVSFSGNCYMSYFIGERSANRGECAQPCRNKYSLFDEKNRLICADKYLLSLKDINRSEYIGEMISAGISSFKIEGRLKDESYVKNVTSYYRKKIDAVLEDKKLTRSSFGKSFCGFDADIKKSFNRGFSDYFLNGRTKEITSFDTPKAIGYESGKIISVGKNNLTVDGKYVCGDGISYYMKDGSLSGAYVNGVSGNKIELSKNEYSAIMQGLSIFKNYDKQFEDSVKAAECNRFLPISISITSEELDGLLRLNITAKDEENTEVSIFSDDKFEIAKNQDMALENIRSSFSKLKDTEFRTESFSFSGKAPFIKMSVLNSLRRDLIEKLTNKREQAYQFERKQMILTSHQYISTEVDFTVNVLNNKARAFYERHGATVLEYAAESGLNLNGKKLMSTKHCLKYSFGMCGKGSELYLYDQWNNRFTLKFDCEKCEMIVMSGSANR